MDVDTLAARLAEVQVVDVRGQDEWEAGRIDGSRHIPLDQLSRRLDELDRGQPIVAVCHYGQRSTDAAALLRDNGFRAESLDGGLDAWGGSGLSMVTDAGPAGPVTGAPASTGLSPELQELHDNFMSLVFAAQDHFGDREPSEDEIRQFLRDRLLSEGLPPEEADKFLEGL